MAKELTFEQVEWNGGTVQLNLGKHIDHVPDEVADAFKSYSWPGNIRELQNVIERMVILSDDGVLANPLRGHRSTDVIKGHCTQIIRHGA
jgi:transcriptional regulator with PAS, ATPase and Fis domain